MQIKTRSHDVFYRPHPKDEKVLLRDRKRHTARGVASLALLSRREVPLSCLRGTPCPVWSTLSGLGYPFPLAGPARELWTGPVTGIGGTFPWKGPGTRCWDPLRKDLRPEAGYPLSSPCEQTNKVKLLPPLVLHTQAVMRTVRSCQGEGVPKTLTGDASAP